MGDDCPKAMALLLFLMASAAAEDGPMSSLRLKIGMPRQVQAAR